MRLSKNVGVRRVSRRSTWGHLNGEGVEKGNPTKRPKEEDKGTVNFREGTGDKGYSGYLQYLRTQEENRRRDLQEGGISPRVRINDRVVGKGGRENDFLG